MLLGRSLSNPGGLLPWEHYPIALEGALKLKEVSYLHAEGYPAAEMKHGPISLIDNKMPVIVVAVKDESYEKIKGNIGLIRAINLLAPVLLILLFGLLRSYFRKRKNERLNN